MHDMYAAAPFRRLILWLATCQLLLLASAHAVAGGDDPYPEFTARYEVRLNGIKAGIATFSLVHEQANQYLYKSESTTTGVASLFGPDTATEYSRWRFVDSQVQPVEYRSRRDDGDDDDNVHLFFHWDTMQVENRGAGEHWNIAMPEGTLDEMVMQLAMLFELREGKRVFKYPVAVRGRIKRYHFEVLGEDTTQLEFGTYTTIKLERKDDDRDKSWVWSAPELNYFPVRFLKKKKSGLKTDILLHELQFKPATPVAAPSSR